jgi:hypothetical protein
VVGCAPEQSAPVQDAALHALNFRIQFSDVSPILDSALALILLTLGDECPFAALVPAIGPRVVEIGEGVF